MENEKRTTGGVRPAPSTSAGDDRHSGKRPPMKRSRKVLLCVAAIAGIAIAALAASTLVVSNQYPTRQVVTRSFTLPDDFTVVRNILVGTSATKEIIIEAGDNEFLDEQRTAYKMGLEALEMNAKLKVRSRDDYIGRPEVLLTQVVKIKADEVHSDIDLEVDTDRLWEYEMITHYLRDKENKNTRVELRLTQEIRTTVPWFLQFVADRRVRTSAERQLVNQERAIRLLIDKNGGKAAPTSESASTAKATK